jgi:dephospho-CoA kinase
MAERPYLVGLTGSIGMGKSETAKMFAKLGIPVYDSDAAVHRLYEKDGAAVEPIANAFAGVVKDGAVDRTELSRQLAANPDGFRKLEALVHPLVAAEQRKFLDEAEHDGAEIVVLDIPLLFETGGHARMDAVVVVSAPSHIQRVRVLAREGMTPGKLDQILSRQTPDAEKRAKAHFVVETGKGLERAFEDVKKVVAVLKARRKKELK